MKPRVSIINHRSEIFNLFAGRVQTPHSVALGPTFSGGGKVARLPCAVRPEDG
ncbi:MAG TPA: hypothetical protein VMF69_24780 [Gemmataceae bacterium]|nr:hypothetical protein [Gemmataceae bacterium]